MAKKKLLLDDREGVLARLFKHTLIDDGHWRWLGSRVGMGYGDVIINGKHYRLNRLSAYLFMKFDLNGNLQVNHKDNLCTYKDCWNPEHLYVGTQSQNWGDRTKLITSMPTFRCGHPRTEENTSRSFNPGSSGLVESRCRICHNKTANLKKVQTKEANCA